MKEANKTYNEYVAQSKSGSGKAGGENVVLMVDGEPEKEYFGPNNEDEFKTGGKVGKDDAAKKIKQIDALCTEFAKGSDYVNDEQFVNGVFDIMGRTYAKGGSIPKKRSLRFKKSLNFCL